MSRAYAFLARLGAALGCHQQPERSFFIGGVQLPLCARCTGLLIGQIGGAAAFALGTRAPWWLCLALIAPLGLDGMIQLLTRYESTNPRRVVTGLLAGGAEVFLFFQGILWLASLSS